MCGEIDRKKLLSFQMFSLRIDYTFYFIMDSYCNWE